jgi:hypothetical protein
VDEVRKTPQEPDATQAERLTAEPHSMSIRGAGLDPFLPPHEFEPGYTGMVCGRLVERNGYGIDCGLPPEHEIHRRNR